jgi:hypothetical protein
MKKLYKSVLFALLANTAMGQTFFTPTTYRGAFAPAPAVAWTAGWTNFDPQATDYNPGNAKTLANGGIVNVNFDITANTKWTSDKIYVLKKGIFVTNNATLTIAPGTIIMGDKAAAGAGLFICRGAKLMAVGTATSPIVFTSNQAANARAKGDWGGIILMGKAKNNQHNNSVNTYIEGIVASEATQFGGDNDADNSGSMKFVRIEFGGYVYQPNKEINGLTMGSVGSGTIIENVQVSYCNDDAFEWFGGTVNCKNLVSFRNLDDDFDTDFGYTGKVQNGLIIRDASVADDPLVSTSEAFESDNDVNGSSLLPITSPIFSNITAVGPYRGNLSSSVASGYRRGLRIRKNSRLKIYNSIFLDFQRGLHIDATGSESNATNGHLIFKNNIIAGVQLAGKMGEVNSGSSFNINSFLVNNSNDTSYATSGANILTDYYSSYTAGDYRPSVGSIARNNPNFTHDSITAYVKTLAPKTITCPLTTLAAINTRIAALSVTGANAYKFRIKTAGGDLIEDVTMTSAGVSLWTNMVNKPSYATTYKVSYAPVYGTITQAFSAECTVTTPTVVPSIVSSFCDAQLPLLTTSFKANTVYGATAYRFLITAADSDTASFLSTSTSFSLSKFAAATSLRDIKFRAYDQEYLVKVDARVNGTWLGYGNACMIYSPNLPLGFTAPTLALTNVNATSKVVANTVTGATKYKFILKAAGVAVDSVVATSGSLTYSSFKNLASKVIGTSYTIAVAVEYRGTYTAYSSPITVTYTGLTPMAKVNNVEVVSFPNPFNDNFQLNFASNNEANVSIVIADLSGKTIESHNVRANEVDGLSFGESFAPGVYTIAVSQGNESYNLKAIKSEK